MKLPDDLHIGDILLYNSADLADEIIDVVSGDDVAHVEVYAGNGQSWASRNGIGVALYTFRPDGLKSVRRLVRPLDESAVEAWFKTVNGTAYGWGDILDNADIQTGLPGMDCSHFAAALLEAGGCPQFDTSYPKLKIKPRDFKLSLASYEIIF